LRVLVTGGAGFIGSHLVRRLIVVGHAVRVADNLSTGHLRNRDPEAEFLELDIGQPGAVEVACRGVDAVFHTAAIPSVARSWKDPLATLAVNAVGTANVMDAAVRAGVKVLIYSSSSSVYGDQPFALRTEGLDPQPVSPYAYSKLLGELITLAYARAGDIRVVALRYFNVFGPGQDPNSAYSAVVPLFIKHAVAGTVATIYGDGLQRRDFTYIDNVVEANLLALGTDANGVTLNVGCGQPTSILELVAAVSSLNGHQLKVQYAEPRSGDIRDSIADLARANATLGYRPLVSFELGLRRTFAWARGG
jgi:UDP-glucose 4-epimerase